MKVVGILGGLGPESTVDYYKRFIRHFQEKEHLSSTGEIVIYSASLEHFLELMEHGDWNLLSKWLITKIEALAQAGAEVAIIGSNTPHIVFDSVKNESPIPLVSIVEATREKASALGLRQLGLLGTKFTMSSDFYQQKFQARQMRVIVPSNTEQELIHDRLFSEIELGILKESTKNELLNIVLRMKQESAIDGVILGCTELPLILDSDEFDLFFLNTTEIHAESVIRLLEGRT